MNELEELEKEIEKAKQRVTASYKRAKRKYIKLTVGLLLLSGIAWLTNPPPIIPFIIGLSTWLLLGLLLEVIYWIKP